MIVNDFFQPFQLYNTKNVNYLGMTQIYIYEIITSYLELSNHFYDL